MFSFPYFQDLDDFWCLVSPLMGQFGVYQPWSPLSLMTLSISTGSNPKETLLCHLWDWYHLPCRVPFGMRLYFLLQIRCSGPGFLQKTRADLFWAMLSSHLRLGTFSLWVWEMPETKPPFRPCSCAHPTWTVQDVNRACLSSQRLSEKSAQQHQPARKPGRKPEWPRSHPALGSTDWGNRGMMESPFFGWLLQAAAGACLGDRLLLDPFAQLGHCTRCHLLFVKPGHEEVLSWHCSGVTWQSWWWRRMDKDTKVNAKHGQTPRWLLRAW